MNIKPFSTDERREGTGSTLRIYLLRHGTAAPQGAGELDAERALVEKGRDQCRRAARVLAQIQPGLSHVLCSPYLRAVQTGQEVLRELSSPLVLETAAFLEPGTPIGEATAGLLAVQGTALLAVGHEPLLSQIAATLLGLSRCCWELRKGGLFEIDVISRQPLQAVLLGLMRPAHLH